MAEEKVVVTMEDYEQRLAVKGLMEFRTDLLEEDMPTEDLDELMPWHQTHFDEFGVRAFLFVKCFRF